MDTHLCRHARSCGYCLDGGRAELCPQRGDPSNSETPCYFLLLPFLLSPSVANSPGPTLLFHPASPTVSHPASPFALADRFPRTTPAVSSSSRAAFGVLPLPFSSSTRSAHPSERSRSLKRVCHIHPSLSPFASCLPFHLDHVSSPGSFIVASLFRPCRRIISRT